MTQMNGILKNDEKAILDLRVLYEQLGYKRYKMSKFEEYDLYVKNKNFLKSENIITFTDMGGRLLALKPDVTLSIANNIKADLPDNLKLYYCENVYRSEGTAGHIEEIMQVGVEHIGDIDLYAMCEVITLALKSLKTISRAYVMDISHMGFVTGILACTDTDEVTKKEILTCISQKNAHGIETICRQADLDAAITEKITALATLYGPFEETLGKARALAVNEKTLAAVKELENIYTVLQTSGMAANLNLDFSIVNDMSYYNGIIFQGFVREIPCAILVGGRYDNLLHKLGKNEEAIGYAVYMNLLESFDSSEAPYDADVLLLYERDTDIALLTRELQKLLDAGKTVNVQKNLSAGAVKCRTVMKMGKEGAEKVE